MKTPVRIKAFTLVELLVALAILVALAAILLPVFASAERAAHRAKCTSNFRQTIVAANLYQQDYDDYHVVVRYQAQDPPAGTTDRIWPQLVLPYLTEIRAQHCPADYTHEWETEALFDEDLVVGDTWARYYAAAQRVNTGYNAVYLAPLVQVRNGNWTSLPRTSSAVSEPAETLVFGDSVWEVTDNGKPKGGGHYLIVPPCRYAEANRRDTFELAGVNDEAIYTANLSWQANGEKGGLWGWHEGMSTVAFADGHIAVRTRDRLADGCDARPDWRGRIFDPARYLWDLR